MFIYTKTHKYSSHLNLSFKSQRLKITKISRLNFQSKKCFGAKIQFFNCFSFTFLGKFVFEPHSLYSIFAHSTFYSIWIWTPSLFQTLTFASKIRLIWVIFQHCESLRMMNIWSLFTNKSKGKSAPFLEQRLLCSNAWQKVTLLYAIRRWN